MNVAEPTVDPDRTLRERFGLEEFRPGQREVIGEVLRGRDVLCVMPTGGGKSLCYQLPALLLPGVTLVVSPLIALMKDQVDALTARGLRATLINSTLDLAEQNARIAEVERGRYDLVYVAPERFRSGRFVEAMNRVKPALFAVDEAHCISEWGHDFRPDYARLGAARRALGGPPCIALTATATDLVRRDIAEQLDLDDPAQFVTGFDRPNLTYHAREARKDADKLSAVAEILGRNPGPAIIYANSRKRCEEVGAFLDRTLRRQAAIYHAGLPREDRNAAQERFMGGEADVVVATNAFGMGVDKANIRSVIHFNMPGTLEAYYQEAGRAGRDGLPAECVMLHAPGDRYLQEMFIDNEYPPAEAVYRVYEYLRSLDADPIELTQSEIRESARVDLNESAVGTALRILETASALERLRPRENMAIVRIRREPDEPPLYERVGPNAHVQGTVARAVEGLVNGRFGEAVYFHPDEFAASLGLDRMALTRAIRNLAGDSPLDYVPPFRGNAVRVLDRSRGARDLEIDFSTLNKRKGREYDKLERMIKYASTNSCRRSYILQYFGDTNASTCGRCDNCGGGAEGGSPRPSDRAIDTPAGREVLQKVLSGVARCKARFGKTAVAQMLIGSNSERMEKTGLTRLSTFGVLAKSGFSQAEIVTILDGLLAVGMAESEDVERFRPILKLSEAGWAWIRDPEAPGPVLPVEDYLAQKICNGGMERVIAGAGVEAPRPGRPPAAPATGGWAGDEDSSSWEPSGPAMGDPLWERLKALRLEWARASNVKAFQIFPNRVMDELVKARPDTPQALAAIKGIGPSTMEKYGAAVLEAIRAGVAEPPPIEASGIEPAPSPPPRPAPAQAPAPAESFAPAVVAAPAPNGASYVPTEEWTYRLLERGFTFEEAAAIRGLEIGAIARHASWMVKKGKTVPVPAFLTPEVEAAWRSHLESGNRDAPEGDGSAASRYWPLFLSCVAPRID